MPWDDGLEGPPRVIAAVEASPLRVTAGPGTGKTHALIRRAARFLEQGTDPRRILVVTFTRTAAADLVRQLGELQINGATDVRAGTLHALCFSALARAEAFEFTGRNPRPLLPFEERFLIEDMAGETFGGVRDRERRLRAFEAAWARLQSDEPGWPQDGVDRGFQAALLAWLRFHQAILIGELVPEALRYLRTNPESPERAAFDHVIVDEYQDLNRAEQALLDLLAGWGSLTVVGDEDQSIYSFKYAHPEGISNFHESHPGTHDENLDECRRCPELVIELANQLIANNPGRDPRQLRPRLGSPEGEVYVVQWQDLEAEAEGLSRFVHGRIDDDVVNAGNILVLCPRRVIGYAIRDALRRRGIAAHSFFHEEALEGNPKRLERSQAQTAFTLLTLLANPEDQVSLRCWLGLGSPSLRRAAYTRLKDYCEQNGAEPRAVLDRLSAGQFNLPYTGELAHRYREVTQLLRALEGLRGQALLDALFPPGQDWSEALRALAEGIGDDFGAPDLRDALRTAITQPELPTDVDFVRVMSLHKSKGLTADMVIVPDCIEGLIPYIDPDLTQIERERMLQEQRRLFYVAITRTTNTLVLSSVVRLPRETAYAMRVPVRGRSRQYAQTVSSRFLIELGQALPAAVRGEQWLAQTQ